MGGVLIVQGDGLPPAPTLAVHVRLAFERSMSRALGPAVTEGQEAFLMRLRPGGAATEVARSLSDGTPFRFSVLPSLSVDTKSLQDHLALEVEHDGRVCLFPELKAILQESSPHCTVRHLRLAIGEGSGPFSRSASKDSDSHGRDISRFSSSSSKDEDFDAGLQSRVP